MELERCSRDDLKYYHICPECAHEKGGRVPKFHTSTAHESFCPYCGDFKPLVSIDDYLWKDETFPRFWD